MPERIEKLRSTLRELESELASIDSLDDDSRSQLQSIIDEISQRLRRRDETAHHESLVTRLKDAAGEFENSHPTLFGIVTRAIDALGQIGI